LINPALKGEVDVLRYLGKELGADVTKAGPDGCTALLHAANLGYLDDVQCLVKDLGADVNQANTNGITPLIGEAQKAANTRVL
jgi:ankyrin repeat protein